MQDAFAYCTELVRTADKDRFLATLFAPAEYRDALFALYAFDIETARIPSLVSEALPGEIRLQWWRETIEGKREGEAAGHPVAFVLGATIARFGLPAAAFDEILAARGFDLYDEPIETLAALETYMERTASDLIGLAAMILNGGSDPGPAALFRHAGLALGLAGLLRDLPVHAERRKLYVPLELLNRYKANAEDIFARKATTELRTVLADLRLRARRHLSEARALLPQATAAIVPALLPLALVRPALRQMDRRRYDPFKPPEIPQWRRQMRLWRAARFSLGPAL
jgi:phytoene synthase